MFQTAGLRMLLYADRLPGWPVFHRWKRDPTELFSIALSFLHSQIFPIAISNIFSSCLKKIPRESIMICFTISWGGELWTTFSILLKWLLSKILLIFCFFPCIPINSLKINFVPFLLWHRLLMDFYRGTQWSKEFFVEEYINAVLS